jgi:hypothetical protein
MRKKTARPHGSVTSQRAAGSEFLGRSSNPQNSQLSRAGQDIKRPRNTHIFQRAAHELYIEPPWTSERLFAVETFPGAKLDPCCGIGMIARSVLAAGLSICASDIAEHGYGERPWDFLTKPALTEKLFSVVTNPPYALAREVVERALKLGATKIAIFFPVARNECSISFAHTTAARTHVPAHAAPELTPARGGEPQRRTGRFLLANSGPSPCGQADPGMAAS